LSWADSDSPPADKSPYTLFNPTPTAALRDMDTDRPNVTNTPHTIDAGHVQIETGLYDWTRFHDRTHGGDTVTDAVTLGHINARLGVTNDLEVNATIDSYDRVKTIDNSAGQTTRANGFGDTVIGGKLNLWGNQGGDDPWASGFALQPQVKLPTAQPGIGNNHVEWTIGAPFLINLVDGFHLGLETAPGQERNTANDGYVVGWQNSASIDHVVFGGVDVYLEYAMHMTSEAHTQPRQSLDVGMTYPVTDNLAIDSGVFIGINRATPGVEWTSGVSFRF
ncbi:MAG TPA: transporter, partial [Stellaceae bacterium]